MKKDEGQDELSINYSSQFQCLEIQWNRPMIEIEIYDLNGICHQHHTFHRENARISTADLQPDTYLIFVRDIDSDKYLAQKLICK